MCATLSHCKTNFFVTLKTQPRTNFYFGNHWNMYVQTQKDRGGVEEPYLPDFSNEKAIRSFSMLK